MPSPSLLELPSKASKSPSAPPPTGRGRTLLIVDDEEGPRQSLRIVFKDEYQILLATNGVEALDLARQHSIDAAVLDIRMYGMSGIELLERLKSIDPAIEVIMLTAYETLETARQALRYGACDYLNKPFDIGTMRAAVRNAMERRAISEEIRTNNEKLERLRTEIQNQKMQQEIMRARGEIYASIIHDINGPLTIILGFIDLINRGVGEATHLDGDGISNVKERLDRIKRQVTTCIEISRRYLRFLRETPSENSTVAVNQILTDLGYLVRTHPSARNQQLIAHPLEAEVVARINGTDLIQILLNLAINALQCTTEAHRVEIKGHLRDQPLDLSQFVNSGEERFLNREQFQNRAPLLALAVSDNGPGIPPGVIESIFEPFFTTKAANEGTGLGLSIVARLVKQAHGAIHLKTKVGEGTTFTVFLSAVAPPVAPLPSPVG